MGDLPPAREGRLMGVLLAAGWTPLLEHAQLARVAKGLRSLPSLDAILDDAGDVLSGQDPPDEEFAVLGERLREDLTRLVDVAVAATAQDPGVTGLADRARALTSKELPDSWRAAPHPPAPDGRHCPDAPGAVRQGRSHL
ncbi:hypothetical protein [Streptomyces albidoflavus]|uniref:hypothetical protein n=1 Tax=Streptomyces albidoflavus TaxID=1886 RepID=UPI001F5DB09D|nr:hypothetical protein [Streptomyces albidoflavus]